MSILASLIFIASCDNDDPDPDPDPPAETGNSKTFNLFLASSGLPEGSVTFTEFDDGSTRVEITIPSTGAAGSHPAHIHNNTGAAGGGIAISLQNVEAATGKSETFVVALDDGAFASYQDLINFDGHVNVHLSETDLGTLVAQGDIGPNEFSPNIEDFDLVDVGGSGIVGDVTFRERASGALLAIIELENTPAGGEHPAHVHTGSVASGGGIAISLNPVDGSTGLSLTDFSALDDGTSINWSQLEIFDGHVKVHLSSSELGTVVSAGDIGGNELTGEMEEYVLSEKAVAGISGTAIFRERESGKTLVEINLENTPQDGVHPAHIHANSAVEGGGVVFPLTAVDGNTGMSYTDISMDGESNVVTYDDLIAFDGYINVHLSAEELSTSVAQGDIGGNVLTGESATFDLNEANTSGVSGTVTFAERLNGNTLATIMLTGTPTDGDHPAHIHNGSVEDPGGIVISFNNVDGNTGMSMTHIEQNDAEEAVTYDDIVDFNGHVKVHLSPTELGTVVASGNIGSNSGARVSYANDIRPILDTNCQISPCHGTNGGIPSWETYDNVSANAAGIKSRTGNGSMPPSSSGKSLTAEQIQMIADWVDDGAPNN